VEWFAQYGESSDPVSSPIWSSLEQAVREISGQIAPAFPRASPDAAEVSRAGIPPVMMFVQSWRGISHNKD